ncbi:MAG: hypothetical protein VW576_07400 [Opitutae bacterium]
MNAKKVSPSVIVASLEGEVSSLNMVDDFKVQMGPTSVGKKINPKTILTTGKTGKIALLFSNGTLITIKPGSRFYLRTYKQLEGIVEGTLDPGKLEEEPTQSELSAHLDYGNLVVKAPKLKKGSSMKLTSPLGTAGIRGTMFQLMAVRNSVTGDIMGGINLISGDIDFTDTGGNTVSLLSGQSIQLATSKLGAPVASQTGELVDLSSTYGPALTDGFSPPPLESVFPGYSEVSSSAELEQSSAENLFPTMVVAEPVSASASDWEMIHELATDLFFEIESAETVAANFSFEDLALAPTVDIPTPEPEAPVAPAAITGQTIAGADLEFFQGGHPELQLLGQNGTSDDNLVRIFDEGARMEVEMRAPSEGITWRKIDPWAKAQDFLGNDITSGVQISGTPTILLPNHNTAENDAPALGEKVSYEVSYTIRDLRGLSTVIFRQVDVIATRPSIQVSNTSPSFPWNELDLDGDGNPFDSFYQWINDHISVRDVRGQNISYSDTEVPGTFYLSGIYDLAAIGTYNDIRVVAIDWRGLRTQSDPFSLEVTSPENLPVLSTNPFLSEFSALDGQQGVLEYGDPLSEYTGWLNSGTAVDSGESSVEVTTKVFGNDALAPVDLANIWPENGMDYTIVFEVVDPRWVAGGSDPLMKNQLTVSETHSIRVVATPPKLEIVFHNPREGLGVSENFEEISYLVRSKENISEYPDDGEFLVIADPGETNREDRKLYYKATAYNGFGNDITTLVTVENMDQVDDTILNEATSIAISVDDKTVRNLSQGAVTTLSPVVKIVDVIAPKLSFPSDQPNPFVVAGIMPEITLLSGSLRDQVSGNSREDYYFNDPGIEIIDNYYTEEELFTFNEIDDTKAYVFKYTNLSNVSDSSVDKTFDPVFEYAESRLQTDLDMAKMGDYTLSYSLSDPSGNSVSLTRSIQVEDKTAPVVKLYGQQTMYVDLQSIFDGESRFYDPGAYAIEDLYQEGKGFFDWDTVDDELAWKFEIQLCNDLQADTYDDAVEVSKDFIADFITELADDPPSQVLRYKFHYILIDRAGNEGRSTRIIELRGSPNLYPTIFFLLSHSDALDGIPANEYIDKSINTATLPTLTWDIEVGEEQYTYAPTARVFTDLGGGQQENLDEVYSISKHLLDATGSSNDDQTILPEQDLSDFFSSVNYWNNNGALYFVEGTVGSYSKYPDSESTNWRRVVLRYSATNSLGNKSVRDIEVRLMDTTAPVITKNTFSEGTLEVGDPFDDPGVNISDSAGSVILSDTTIDLPHPQGGDDNSTFIELSNRGFWEAGDFTITYTAEDEFGNQADTQILNLNVQDSTDPHVAVVTHDVLNKYNSNSGIATSDLSYQNANNPLVSPNSIFENDTTLSSKLQNLSVHYDNFTFSSEDPFVMEDDPKNFILKASELHSDFLQALRNDPQSLVNSTSDPSSYIQVADIFGRTFSWYSPITIVFNDSTTLQDPGFLIYEPSNSGVTINANIDPEFYGEEQNQTKNITISITVTQNNTSARQTIINTARTYTFLDDIKPLISISPYTDSNSTFIVVEAGATYDDSQTSGDSYRMLRDGVLDEVGELLSVRADDVADGSITSSIVRTISDLNDSLTGSVVTSYPHVNHIYKIEYNVQDSEGNAADSVFRYLVIKDTIAPLIYPQADANASDNFEVDYLSTSPNVNSTSAIEDHLLSGLVASDYGALGAGVSDTIDGNLDTIANRNKWTVEITKPITDSDPVRGFDEGRVYPFAKDDNGYVVTITVTDEFGNTSPSRTRSLKIGDYQKPVIGLIGDSIIHDFLRYSTNSALGSETEEISGQDFNATGFGGGMHRIMLDNYTFVDPGAYAHDYNSYFSTVLGYKDLQGDDGYGETYAMRRVQDRAEMEACADIGVIYVYSALNNDLLSDPFVHYQSLMQDNIYGSDTNVTITPSENVRVPDVEGNNYTFAEENKTDGLNMDVVRLTNEYRVRDGWGNKADIVERTIYIYESRQFPGFAFYATPLTDGDGLPFEHLYDDGTPNRAYLNDTRKDTDGDGVSDFWEKAFGSNPTDSTSVPTEDLSDPTIYNTIDFNTSNAQ